MTTKRFTIKPSMIVDDVTVIIDNQKEYTFPVLDSTLNYMFCKTLNEFTEENEQLKSFIKKLTNRNGEILLMNGYGYTKSYVEKLLNEKELEK